MCPRFPHVCCASRGLAKPKKLRWKSIRSGVVKQAKMAEAELEENVVSMTGTFVRFLSRTKCIRRAKVYTLFYSRVHSVYIGDNGLCGRRELNPYTFRYQILSLARL